MRDFIAGAMIHKLWLNEKQSAPVIPCQLLPRAPVSELRLFAEESRPIPAVKFAPRAPVRKVRLSFTHTNDVGDYCRTPSLATQQYHPVSTFKLF